MVDEDLKKDINKIIVLSEFIVYLMIISNLSLILLVVGDSRLSLILLIGCCVAFIIFHIKFIMHHLIK